MRRCGRGEKVESGTLRIAIDQIEMIRLARAERLAAAQPIGQVMVAICNSSGVVIGGVERLPIHRAVNNHDVPRRCSNWYITQPFGSLQTPQTEAGWRAVWMACQIRCGVAGMSRCVTP